MKLDKPWRLHISSDNRIHIVNTVNHIVASNHLTVRNKKLFEYIINIVNNG